MKSLGFALLALTFHSPALAWQMDARKACELLKAANERKVAELEAKSPYREFKVIAQAGVRNRKANSVFMRIINDYANAYRDLMEGDLSHEDRQQIEKMISDATQEEAQKMFGQIFPNDFRGLVYSSKPVQVSRCEFLSEGGHLKASCTLVAHLDQQKTETYVVTMNLTTDEIDIHGGDGAEIRRLKSLDSLPAHCRQYFENNQ